MVGKYGFVPPGMPAPPGVLCLCSLCSTLCMLWFAGGKVALKGFARAGAVTAARKDITIRAKMTFLKSILHTK